MQNYTLKSKNINYSLQNENLNDIILSDKYQNFIKHLLTKHPSYNTQFFLEEQAQYLANKRPFAQDLSAIKRILSTPQLTFSQTLINIIKQKQLSNTQVYKQAHIDRKLFSKIITNPHYQPSRNTIISLGIALSLSLDEFNLFLQTAGFSLSNSQTDLIIKYFLQNNVHSLLAINEMLFHLNLPLI